MSEYSRHMSWMSRCSTGRSYGMTAGDTFYLGLQTYDQPYQCPNGLGVDERPFQEFEWYKRRLAKAKRDIEAHREQMMWQRLGEESAVEFAADDVAGIIDLVKGAFDVE